MAKPFNCVVICDVKQVILHLDVLHEWESEWVSKWVGLIGGVEQIVRTMKLSSIWRPIYPIILSTGYVYRKHVLGGK